METIKKQIDDALAAQANNHTIQMSLDDLIQLQADVAEIKRLLFAATDDNNKDNLSIAIDELRGIIISQFDNLIIRLDNMLDVSPSSKDSANV
jgi:hypothetical protein